MSRPERTRCLVAYATKKGTSKGIAEQFASLLNYDIEDIANLDVSDIQNCKMIILVVSNYGKGEPPKTTTDFWTTFDSIEDEDYLRGVEFAVFGCGSTRRLETYQHFTKHVEQRMLSLGATEIASRGELDAQSEDQELPKRWISKIHRV